MALQSTTAIATITLQEDSSSVTFSSIPAIYRDLIFVINGRLVTDTITDTLLRVNGDSGSNYSRVYAYGDGSITDSGSATLTSFFPFYLRGLQANAIGELIDYSATDKHKTLLSRQNAATGASVGVSMQAQRWANTAAIYELEFSTTNTYAKGMTFALFGRVA